jgi:hypothetical protein
MAEAKGINPKITTEEIVTDAKEEVKAAPSRIRKKLHQLAAVWEDASVRSSASASDVVGSGLAGMYALTRPPRTWPLGGLRSPPSEPTSLRSRCAPSSRVYPPTMVICGKAYVQRLYTRTGYPCKQ